MNISKHYNQSIDILRIISIIAVVLIHTTTRTLEGYHLNISQDYLSLFLNQICRFSVPLFFLISGFVLELNYNNHLNYFAYLKKRFNKILIPYIVWSTIYFFIVYPQPLSNYFTSLISGNSSYQLYFIPSLLIFYLSFPLIRKIYNLKFKNIFFIILFFIEIYFLYRDYHAHNLNIYYPVGIFIFNIFPFIFGIFASHHQQRITTLVHRFKLPIFLSAFFTSLYVFFQGMLNYQHSHNYLDFYSQWRPSVLIYTILIFSIIFYIFNEIRHFDIIKKISNLSFFVFFIHVIVLEISWNYIFKYLFLLTYQNIFLKIIFDISFYLFITLLSFLLAHFVKKNNFLNKTLG